MRPEQRKTSHDESALFSADSAKAASDISLNQPKKGEVSGFDFYRDPLNSDQPKTNPEDIMRRESANKQAVMNAQKEMLERRYNLSAKTDPKIFR